MPTVTLSGSTGAVVDLSGYEPAFSIAVFPGSGNTTKAQLSYSNEAAAHPDLANWFDWIPGAVDSPSVYEYSGRIQAVRFVRMTGSSADAWEIAAGFVEADAMSAFEDFFPMIFPECPGVPEPAAILALRRAAIELCQRAMLWRLEIDPIDIAAGVTDYTLSTPLGTGLSKVLNVSYNGNPLEAVIPESIYSQTDYATKTQAAADAWYMTNPNTVRLYPQPLAAIEGGLRVAVSLMPSRSATSIPQWMYEQYADCIVFGALENLLAAPGKAWSNPELALWYHNQFEAEVSSIAGKVSVGFARAPQRTRAYI